MRNFFFLIVGLVIIFGSIFLYFRPIETGENQIKTIKINDTEIKVEVVDTPKTRARGLSGRRALKDGTGMFFVFEAPGEYGFWMKDMNFAIDIAWIDEKFHIIDVEKEVKPETFPEIFYPSHPIKYVLELPAGTLEKHYIDIGAVVQ